jgi:hypothetical protein
MKKIIVLFVLATLTVSCGSLFELLELKIENDLTEDIDVSVPKTAGVTGTFNLTETLDLRAGDFAEYVDKITAVKINTFNYKYKDFIGNANGVVTSGTLKFDDVVVGTVTNLNISQAATAATVFEITDANVLSQLEDAFVNNSSTTITLSGNVLSEAGPMDFKVEVNISLTVTVKE